MGTTRRVVTLNLTGMPTQALQTLAEEAMKLTGLDQNLTSIAGRNAPHLVIVRNGTTPSSAKRCATICSGRAHTKCTIWIEGKGPLASTVLCSGCTEIFSISVGVMVEDKMLHRPTDWAQDMWHNMVHEFHHHVQHRTGTARKGRRIPKRGRMKMFAWSHNPNEQDAEATADRLDMVAKDNPKVVRALAQLTAWRARKEYLYRRRNPRWVERCNLKERGLLT